MADRVFCRIAAGGIPARKVFEDEVVVASTTSGRRPQCIFWGFPGSTSLVEVGPEHAALPGRILAVGARLARDQGCAEGFRTIINTGRVGRQEVYHLHLHILGGPDPLPPKLKY